MLRGRGWIVAVVAAVAVVATACSSSGGKPSAQPVQSKLVDASQIRRVNVVVVPANAAVQAALDASPVVQSYARITHLKASDTVRCAVAAGGFAVQQAPVDVDIATPLAQTLGAQEHALVHDMKGPQADGRVTFKPDATVANVNAVRVALSRDPLDVSGYNFRESARPQSFDFNGRKPETLTELKRRFESFAGVDKVVIYPNESSLLTANTGQSPPTNCPTP